MNPFAYWAAVHTELLDHGMDDLDLAQHRRAATDELTPLERDGRWAATIRRWAEQDAIAADADRIEAVAAEPRRRRDHRPSPSW